MSRRVVFCCGAFRAKQSCSFRGHERERERKREGKAPYLFPPISSLSLFFFSQTLNTWDIFFFKSQKGREKIMPRRVEYHECSRVRKEKSEETKKSGRDNHLPRRPVVAREKTRRRKNPGEGRGGRTRKGSGVGRRVKRKYAAFVRVDVELNSQSSRDASG
jgi:hypothetical protein